MDYTPAQKHIVSWFMLESKTSKKFNEANRLIAWCQMLAIMAHSPGYAKDRITREQAAKIYTILLDTDDRYTLEGKHILLACEKIMQQPNIDNLL